MTARFGTGQKAPESATFDVETASSKTAPSEQYDPGQAPGSSRVGMPSIVREGGSGRERLHRSTDETIDGSILRWIKAYGMCDDLIGR